MGSVLPSSPPPGHTGSNTDVQKHPCFCTSEISTLKMQNQHFRCLLCAVTQQAPRAWGLAGKGSALVSSPAHRTFPASGEGPAYLTSAPPVRSDLEMGKRIHTPVSGASGTLRAVLKDTPGMVWALRALAVVGGWRGRRRNEAKQMLAFVTKTATVLLLFHLEKEPFYEERLAPKRQCTDSMNIQGGEGKPRE